MATLGYDTHGNTSVLADQVLGYDVADQHVRTVLADGTVVTYLRDARGEVVKRTVDPVVGPDVVVKFSGGGGVALTLTSGGVELEATVGLPGGASVIVMWLNGEAASNYKQRWIVGPLPDGCLSMRAAGTRWRVVRTISLEDIENDVS